jgi:hypothetical protein
MASRLRVEGNAKTAERSIGLPPDDFYGFYCSYYITGDTPLLSKQTHLM